MRDILIIFIFRRIKNDEIFLEEKRGGILTKLFLSYFHLLYPLNYNHKILFKTSKKSHFMYQ